MKCQVEKNEHHKDRLNALIHDDSCQSAQELVSMKECNQSTIVDKTMVQC